MDILGKKTYFTLIEKMGLIKNLNIGEIRMKKIKTDFNKRFTPSNLKISIMVSLQEIIKQKLVLLAVEPE